MNERTITLASDLVEELEWIATQQNCSLNELMAEVVETLREKRQGISPNGWALALAETMEQAPIAWEIEPNLSSESLQNYQDYLNQRRSPNHE
jgi:hypothetical protein